MRGSIKIVYLLSQEEANSNQQYSDSGFNESLFLKKSQSYIPLIYCLKLQLAKESKINIHLKMVLQGIHFKPLERNGAGSSACGSHLEKNAMIIRGFSSIQSQSMKNCKWISTSILAITIITARSQQFLKRMLLLLPIYYYTLSRSQLLFSQTGNHGKWFPISP